jgi:hypothetical protein
MASKLVRNDAAEGGVTILVTRRRRLARLSLLSVAVIVGCPSVPVSLLGEPWSFGQSGNEAAQTATSPTDLQFLCSGASGTQLRNFIWDTTSPYDSNWTQSTVPLAPFTNLTGTHVLDITEATPRTYCTYANCPFSGPLGMAAIWVDNNGTVWNADQQGGKWGQPQEVGGSLQGGVVYLDTPQSALRDPPGIAALQLSGTTELAFWIGSDQSVWMNARGANGWGTPNPIAPAQSAVGTIDAVAESSSSVDVVWISPIGGIVDASWNGNPNYTFSVNSIGQQGASISSGITAVVGGAKPGDLNVFWVSTNGQVMQEVRDANSGTWLGTPTTLTQGPNAAALDTSVAAATTTSSGALHAAAGRVYVAWVDPSGVVWTACNDVGAACSLRSTPATWDLVALPTGGRTLHRFAPSAPNPLAIASRTPTTVDILYVSPNGSVWDAASDTSTGRWTETSVAPAQSCDACGQGANGWACNGACPQGTATVPVECGEGNGTGGCNPLGGDGICYACGNTCPATSCSQSGTVLQDSCYFSGECCLCDPTIYPATLNPELFSLFIAPQIADFAVNVTNNELTIQVPTLPDGGAEIPGFNSPPPSNISGTLPANTNVASLSIPSPWNWTFSCGGMIATTTLSATINTGCPAGSATITITNAPVTIDLSIGDPFPMIASPGQFASQGAAVGLVYNQNTSVSECLIGVILGGFTGQTGSDVTTAVQQALEDALDQQLSQLINGSNTILSQMLTASANQGLFAPQNPNLSATNVTTPTAQQFAWSCEGFPGCLPSNNGTNGLLTYCTKVCSGGVPTAPSVGLGPGAPCLGNGECGTDICNSDNDMGTAPFVCCSQVCQAPCSICGADGNCHNSGDQGC